MLEEELSKLKTLEEKADLVARTIVSYKKRPQSSKKIIVDSIFHKNRSQDEINMYVALICDKVLSILEQFYPDITCYPEDLNCSKCDIARFIHDLNIDAILKTKKWQTKPYFLIKNDYPNLLLERKNSLFAEQGNDIVYFSKDGIRKGINNKVEFFENQSHNRLYSLVKTISFIPVNGEVKLSEEVDLKDLICNKDYTCFLDIASYILPSANLENAINIIRYDGIGFEHVNLLLKNEEHAKVFGKRATVPHFHFQNNIENILYLQKVNNNNEDNRYISAGANAIDCLHLINYLQMLDSKNKDELENMDDMNMPFLYFKQNNIKPQINLDDCLKIPAEHQNLDKKEIKILLKLYKDITNCEGKKPSLQPNDPSGGASQKIPANNNINDILAIDKKFQNELMQNEDNSVKDNKQSLIFDRLGQEAQDNVKSYIDEQKCFDNLITSIRTLQMLTYFTEKEKNRNVKRVLLQNHYDIASSIINEITFQNNKTHIINNVMEFYEMINSYLNDGKENPL